MSNALDTAGYTQAGKSMFGRPFDHYQFDKPKQVCPTKCNVNSNQRTDKS